MHQQTAARSTPWGRSQFSRQIADDIIRYYTASHGGYFVPAERVAQMPEALRPDPTSIDASENGFWFEEDDEWIVLALSFPQFFTSEVCASAEKTLLNWRPDVWEKWSGKTATADISEQRKTELQNRLNGGAAFATASVSAL